MIQKKPPTIFETEPPNVPDNWEVLPFGKATDVVSDQGRRVKKRDYIPDGKIPVIDQGQEYVGGYTDNEEMVFDGELPVILFGDHTRAIKFVDKPFAVGAEGIKILKPKPFYVPKFFFYLLKSLRIPSRGYSRHFQFLKKFYFPLASESQQKRIVAEIEKQFSRLDEAVENLQRVKANLKRYKASVLKDAVEGKLTEHWRAEHPDVEPASKLLERILTERRKKWEEAEVAKIMAKGKVPKDDKWKKKYMEPPSPDVAGLIELPKGWAWTCMGQAFEVCIGATPSRRKTEYWNGSVPWVSSGEVAFCRIKMTRETISELGLKNTSTKVHPIGTVLLGMIGEGKTRGQAAILDIEACNNQNAAAIRVSETSILPEYIYLFLEKEYEDTRKRGSGGNQPALNKSRVMGIPFPLPPLLEQLAIVEEIQQTLSNIESMSSIINLCLVRADRLRQSILKKAFSGKLLKFG